MNGKYLSIVSLFGIAPAGLCGHYATLKRGANNHRAYGAGSWKMLQ
jgi:hypothetical protein